MLKSFYFQIFLSLFIFKAQGQITISNTIFPKPGDTLRSFFTFSVEGGLDMGSTGGPKTWDFNKLTSGFKSLGIFTLPSAGKDAVSFPEANLLLLSNDQETYIKSSTQLMEVIGLGGGIEIFDTSIAVKYSKRPVFRKAPLAFINTTLSEAEFRIDVSSSIIPDSLLSTLPIKPDSIRVQFSNIHRGLIDAYGTLKIHNKNFDVLREKAEIIVESKIFLKVLGLWLDLSSISGVNLPGEVGTFLTKDTTIAYNFYSNTNKEVIVSASYDPSGILKDVNFIDLGSKTSSYKHEEFDSSIKITPNPASEFVDLDLKNIAETTTCIVEDMSGRSVYFNIFSGSKENLFRIDVAQWPKGMYIVRLLSKSGNTLFNQKLMKQ